MKVGSKIRDLRERKKMSQENMADILKMSVNGYGKIERDEVSINLERLDAIAKALDTAPEELIKSDSFVFNVYGQQNCGYLHGNQYNFPEKLQQLYDDKIKLLEEKVEYLKKGR
jgi:transcriptional regulator with XRE-family HTH domain